MKIRTPTAPPQPQPQPHKDPKTDFTAEGSPPPGHVAGTGPVAPAPAPPRPPRIRGTTPPRT